MTSNSEQQLIHLQNQCISLFYNNTFGEDFTAKFEFLKPWFGKICRLGAFIGYYVNPTKTWLLVKDRELEKAFRIYAGKGMKITSNGRGHVG